MLRLILTGEVVKVASVSLEPWALVERRTSCGRSHGTLVELGASRARQIGDKQGIDDESRFAKVAK